MKNGNGNGDMAAEITRLEREIARVEQLGPPLAERQAEAMAKLEAAEAHFRQHGFSQLGVGTMDRARYDRLMVIGALMTIGKKQLVEAETARCRTGFNGGMSEVDKTKQLATLRAGLRKLYARQEIAWRASEQAAGELAERITADGEMFLLPDTDLQLIAEGREAA